MQSTGTTTSESTTSEEDAPPVLVSQVGHVAVITLNRPKVLNAMTLPMATAYADALRAADADPAVRAIVVTGAGRGFCAGADLAVLRQGPDAIHRFVPRAEDLPDLALRLRKPVIAAINGPVAGIGFAYLLGSDIRYAASTATISSSFARLGLVAEYGVSWLLPRVVGTTHALELLFSGGTVSAEEAARIGLVQHVTEPGEALTRALAHATELAESCSPASLAAIKAQVWGDLDRPRDDAVRRAFALMDTSFDGPDLAEALAARSEKRRPVFTPLPPTRATTENDDVPQGRLTP
ncbi:enoyl-CoA hydratase-related protein [Streptomyces sp. NPDC091271]|uniref:enoyl-CoA hydratase-related protein n=1 Tax=Streptomyces sp. NPDC091271 TaxID=3365980 RepID=UPI003818EEF9